MMDDSIINQPTADGISIVLENLGREKSSETVADCVLSTSGTVQVNVFPPHLQEKSDDMRLHSSTKDITDPISNTSFSSGGTMASSFFDINIKELFEDMSLASERPSSRSSSKSFEVLKWVADQEQSSNEYKLERLSSFDMEMDAHNIGRIMKKEENRKNIIEKPLDEETNRNERLELENQFLRGELLRLEKELKIFKEERKKIEKEKVELKREAARKIEQEKKLLEEKWDKVTVNFQKQFEDLRKLLVKERTEKEDQFEKQLKEEKQRTQDNEKQMQQEREKAEKKRQVEEQNLYRELLRLQEERKLFEEERRKFGKEKMQLEEEFERKSDQEKRLLEERSRLVEELKKQLEKEQHFQEEKKRQQQERRKKQQQEEKRREVEEEKSKKSIIEEICRIEVERRRIEEEKRQAEEKKIKEEEIRLLKVEEEWLKSRHKEEMSSLEVKRNDALTHIQPQTAHRNLTSHGSLVKIDSSLDETTDADHIENAPEEEFQKELNSALSDSLLQNIQSFFKDQSEITVEVFSSEKKVSVVVNGTEAYLNAPSYQNARGIHIVILDEAYGSFLTSRVFDTYSPGRDEHMIQFLMDVQDGRILIFAVQDEASKNLRKFARDYLTNLGSKHSNHIRWRDMWVFVATKGGKPLGERLSIKEHREAFAEPAVIKVNISVSQLSVQLPKWHQLVTSCASLVKLTEFALASDEKCVRDTLHRLLTLLAPSMSLNGE